MRRWLAYSRTSSYARSAKAQSVRRTWQSSKVKFRAGNANPRHFGLYARSKFLIFPVLFLIASLSKVLFVIPASATLIDDIFSSKISFIHLIQFIFMQLL